MSKQTKEAKHFDVDVKVRDFCGKSKVFFIIGFALILISLLSTFTGVDVALEFKGGTIITYSYVGDVDESSISKELTSLVGSSVKVQQGDSLDSDTKTLSLSFSSTDGLTIDRQNEVTDKVQELCPDNEVKLLDANDVNARSGGEFFAKCIVAAIFAALILIALCYWFFGTELGASIRATGCNEQMARAQGINTGFNKVLALMISNGLVGLCGGIYAQYQGAADVNMGRGAIVIGLAAVIISEVIFGKFCAHRKAAFAFTLGAVFIGAILYYLVIALVLWLKMPSDYMKLFSAVVVACFLAVPYMKDTYFKKGRAK